MHTLASELANESSPVFVRNAAGLALKNALTARVRHAHISHPLRHPLLSSAHFSYRFLQDNARQAEYSTRWLALDVKIRSEIKEFVLRGLHSEQVKAGTVAAQSVAAIATVELPQGQWPDLIEILLRFVNTGTSVPLRQSTLSAIGFICEALVRLLVPFPFEQLMPFNAPNFRIPRC
jgi:importin subunit beta-1